MRPPLVILSQTALRLTGLAGIALGLAAHAQSIGFGESTEEDPIQNLPGMEMLVDGSILEGVLIPRYDEANRLISSLTAKKLVLIDEKTINATQARIEFYHDDESVRGGIDLKTAILKNANMLRSSEPVKLRADDFEARGSGLIFQLDRSRGLLLGPANARMMIPQKTKETSMNSRSPLLSAAGALMLASTTVQAEEIPNRLTSEETEGLNRLAVSAEPEMEARQQSADASIKEAEAQMAEAGGSLESFLKKAAINLPQGPTPDLTEEVAAPDTSMIKNPASVTARDGIFFNSEEGVLVMMKDVEFDHPQFSLKGADEVKVFFSKPPEAAAEANGEKETNVDFGEASKITAVGELVLEKKVLNPGEKSAKASGRQMIYDVENDIFIIRGGRPWVISEGLSGYVTDPSGYIRFNVATGDASFVGESRGLLDSLSGDLIDSDPFSTDRLRTTDFRTKINPKLPTVLVLGDSISIGYTLKLRERLDGQFNVVRPTNGDGTPINCVSTQRALENLDKWLAQHRPDLVTFNFGLWDIASEQRGTTSITPDQYAENLRTISTRLKATGAKIFWVNSTYVPDGATARENENLIKFNQVASNLMTELNIPVIDLYTTSSRMTPPLREGRRNVHYTGEGSDKLAAILADSIQ